MFLDDLLNAAGHRARKKDRHPIDEGMIICLIEQVLEMDRVMALWAYALLNGRLALVISGDEFRVDPHKVGVYPGVQYGL